LKIGFDISQTGLGKAGCGYFADCLITNLAEIDKENAYLLYSAFGTGYWDPDHARATRSIKKANFKRVLPNFSHRESISFWEKHREDLEEQIGKPDIIHANNYFCPKGLKKSRLVYTLYDLQFLEHPEWTTEANRCTCFDGVFDAALHADMMISISHHTKQHFLELFPFYPEDRIKVVHLASRFSLDNGMKEVTAVHPELQSENFWLAVGTVEPRKNLRRLLKAFSQAKKEHGLVFKLALAGGKGWCEDDLGEYIQSLGIENDVYLLGYVTDDQLIWLYKNCYAFVYPSLFEGFGLPVVEAMSLGAAVITSNSSSLPEVAGEAAISVNPENENKIMDAILNLNKNDELRLDLKQKAYKWSKKFSWGKAAQQVLEVYSEVIDKEIWRKAY
jgi:glycosyltransferase involved in cell wall biosynthesis